MLLFQQPRKLPSIFLEKIKANKSDDRITSLETELQMVDTPMKKAWEILAKEAKNPILRYLANLKESRPDYHYYETDNDISKLRARLQAIFPDKDLSKTNSLFEVVSKCKMIKSSEDPRIKERNGDIKNANEKEGCLIRTQNFVRRRIFFNHELLRLELNMTKEQFSEYQMSMKLLLEEISPKEDEFQQKYIRTDSTISIQDFIEFMKQQGCEYEGVRVEDNEDDYYDNKKFGLLKSDREFRKRDQVDQDGKSKLYLTYKDPKGKGEFSHRRNISREIRNPSDIPEIKKSIEDSIQDSIQVRNIPLLHVATLRKKLLFKKGDKEFCVSWDESEYDNIWLGTQAPDVMLEIASRGESKDRLILKGIQGIMNNHPEKFKPYNGSKVRRGTYLTFMKCIEKAARADNTEPKNPESKGNEKELKYQFKEENRQEVKQIVQKVLKNLGFKPEEESRSQLQKDTYYDTPYFRFARNDESLRAREYKQDLEGTYKIPAKEASNMFNRNENDLQINENSAAALVKSVREQQGSIMTRNIDKVIFVDNQRQKRDYNKNDECSIEEAFDNVTNTYLKTGRSKKATLGEFELEFKGTISHEKAEELASIIDPAIKRECATRGIWIRNSTCSKYNYALIDLGVDWKLDLDWCLIEDPNAGGPSVGEPSVEDPNAGGPSVGEPNVGEPNAGGPNAGGPSVGDSDGEGPSGR